MSTSPRIFCISPGRPSFRYFAAVSGDQVQLWSWNGNDYSHTYRWVTSATRPLYNVVRPLRDEPLSSAFLTPLLYFSPLDVQYARTGRAFNGWEAILLHIGECRTGDPSSTERNCSLIRVYTITPALGSCAVADLLIL